MVESVKAASDFTPVDAEILEVNEQLHGNPEAVNMMHMAGLDGQSALDGDDKDLLSKHTEKLLVQSRDKAVR